MVWSLISLVTGIVIGVTLWIVAGELEKKKAMQQTVANPNDQDDMDDYED